jgi:hypothetical protein
MRFASQPVKLRIANVDRLRELVRPSELGFFTPVRNIAWSKSALADLDGEPPSSQETTPQTLIYSG